MLKSPNISEILDIILNDTKCRPVFLLFYPPPSSHLEIWLKKFDKIVCPLPNPGPSHRQQTHRKQFEAVFSVRMTARTSFSHYILSSKALFPDVDYIL